MFSTGPAGFSVSAGGIIAYRGYPQVQRQLTWRAEIYIRPFSGVAGPQPPGQWQVSTAGGAQPRWSPDGREMYWIAPDAKLMAAPIAVRGSAVEPGTPVALFQTRILNGGADQPSGNQYAVARDGRFLINTVVGDEATPPITVLQNWRGLAR